MFLLNYSPCYYRHYKLFKQREYVLHDGMMKKILGCVVRGSVESPSVHLLIVLDCIRHLTSYLKIFSRELVVVVIISITKEAVENKEDNACEKNCKLQSAV